MNTQTTAMVHKTSVSASWGFNPDDKAEKLTYGELEALIRDTQEQLDAAEEAKAEMEKGVKEQNEKFNKMLDEWEQEDVEEMRKETRELEEELRAEGNKVDKLEARNKALRIESNYGKLLLEQRRIMIEKQKKLDEFEPLMEAKEGAGLHQGG